MKSILSLPPFALVGALLGSINVAAASVWSDEIRAMLPAAATPRVLVQTDSNGWLQSSPDHADYRIIPATDASFDQALQVAVPRGYPNPWDVVVHSPDIEVDLPAGRVLLATIAIRATVTQGGESGTAKVFLQRTPEWEGLGETGGTLDANWRQLHIATVTEKSYAAGTVGLSVHLGFDRQTVELGPISILDVGAATDVDFRTLPQNLIRWPGMEPDAAWRTEAAERIDRYRKRDLELTVLDANGHPIEGAMVKLTQAKRATSIGSFTGYELLEDGEDGAQMRDKYERLFDRVTVPIYWADWGWLSQEERYVALAQWAAEQEGMDIRGHTLIYPGWRFMPSFMRDLADDPEAFQEACLAQIRWVGERLSDIPFDELDVTNELRQLTEVAEIVGVDGIAAWFAEARRAFPGVKLTLNENTILSNGGNTDFEQADLLKWYHLLKERGQAPDVLGLQAHFSEAVTGVEDMWRILDRLAAETDAEIQITEFDLNTLNDEAQAAYTRDFYTAMFAHPAVTGITMWGFWEGDHWIPQAANWREDWTPRPSAEVYEELLGRTWRTDLKLTTDDDGTVAGRVFVGELNAAIVLPNGESVKMPITVEAGRNVSAQTLRLR
jgi:endo-1,4-beta-xylanase